MFAPEQIIHELPDRRLFMKEGKQESHGIAMTGDGREGQWRHGQCRPPGKG